MDLWLFLLVLLAIFIVLYNTVTIFHYYSRIAFFYVCIFINGFVCTFLMVPSYLRGGGADLIFHLFRYYTLWTGITMEVRGFDENLENLDEPAVVICNHQSTLDVVAMTYVWPPRGTVMMKKSLVYIPFFNSTSWLANSIFVNRFNKNDAQATVRQCAKQLTEMNHKLWIFPEGTRSQNGTMLPFKKGAFNIAVQAQIKIVPIVLSDYRPFYSEAEKYFKNDGEVIAQILPTISTKGKTLEDVPQLAEEVREQMIEVFQKISIEAEERMDNKRKLKAN